MEDEQEEERVTRCGRGESGREEEERRRKGKKN
jgi:hypothetical protein